MLSLWVLYLKILASHKVMSNSFVFLSSLFCVITDVIIFISIIILIIALLSPLVGERK